MKQINTVPCPTCGNSLSADDVFCKHCFTMDPMVREFLEHNPKPHPKDYLTVDSLCPHCKVKVPRIHSAIKQHALIHSPIRYCRNCSSYYL